MDRAGAAGTLVGEFVIPLASIVAPVLAAAVSAWFQGRAGRKLRLKVGDIDATGPCRLALRGRRGALEHGATAGQCPPRGGSRNAGGRARRDGSRPPGGCGSGGSAE